MAVLLGFRFPWGRYHATPWGRYVNEGAVELPPSPWRLLRALYATWQVRVPEHLAAETVHGLLGRLADLPPTYHLPPYRLAHTRHYYPDSQHRTGKISVDRNVDAFAVFDRGERLVVSWNVDLDAEEIKALDRLAASIPYLGRADSLCEAEVLDGLPEDLRPGDVAVPLGADDELPTGMRRTELLAAAPPLEVQALTRRPVDVRARRRVFPPGTRLVPYAVPEPTTVHRPPRPPHRRQPVTAVRLTLTAPGPPPLSDAVAVTELLRDTCVKRLNGIRDERRDHSLLVGKDDDGRPLTGHQHAHYLALDVDGDRRIDELLIWAPGELSPDELDAISRARVLYAHERQPGPRRAEVRIAGFGGVEDMGPELLGPAQVWESVTPFCPPHHRKAREEWKGFLVDNVRRELDHRHYPEPREVELLVSVDWAGFIRYRPRRDRTRAKSRLGHGLRLIFDDPVTGPLALGELSHFGLGLFYPAEHDGQETV